VLPRRAEKVRVAALFLPAQGIDRNRPESPSNRRITSPDLSSSAAKFAAAGHPLDKKNTPVYSR
jgi:hypothetical protein